MLSRSFSMANALISSANEQLDEYAPTTIIIGTLASVYLLNKTYMLGSKTTQFIKKNWPVSFFDKKQIQKSTAQILRHVPIVGPIIEKEADKELAKLSSDIQASVDKHRKSLGPIYSKIPEQGLPKDFIINIISQANDEYKNNLNGRVSGMMYTNESKEYNDLLDETYSLTKFTNPMHDEEFPLIDKMNAEILAMYQTLFKGNVTEFNSKEKKKLAGLVTDGGTSSVMEVCSAYVKYARSKGIEKPEIIIPSTAHVSFKNATERFGAKLIEVPVDLKTGKADITAIEKAITKNTCMMVGSAPSFPCGVFDPIEELAAIAKKHNVLFHVDACLGGLLYPFAKAAGYNIPSCDFSVPGVSSISCDPHKYGKTPKGSSIALYHPDNPASSFSIYTDLKWAGGMYVAQGMKGSRPGHVVGTTWAATLYHGMDGYTNDAKNILELTKKLSDAIQKIDGIRLLYPTELSVIAMSTTDNDINPYLVASRLKKSHWNLNTIQTPPGLHLCITAAHVQHQDMIMKEFIRDLTDAVEYAKAHPFEKPSGTAGVYGMLPEVPDFMDDKIGNMYASIHNSFSQELLEQAFEIDEESKTNVICPKR